MLPPGDLVDVLARYYLRGCSMGTVEGVFGDVPGVIGRVGNWSGR